MSIEKNIFEGKRIFIKNGFRWIRKGQKEKYFAADYVEYKKTPAQFIKYSKSQSEKCTIMLMFETGPEIKELEGTEDLEAIDVLISREEAEYLLDLNK